MWARIQVVHLYKNRAVVTRSECRSAMISHTQRHTRILLRALTHMCVLEAIQCAHIYITHFEQCSWHHQIWAKEWEREREPKKVQPYIMPLIEWMAKKCQIFNIHALKSICYCCACVPNSRSWSTHTKKLYIQITRWRLPLIEIGKHFKSKQKKNDNTK